MSARSEHVRSELIQRAMSAGERSALAAMPQKESSWRRKWVRSLACCFSERLGAVVFVWVVVSVDMGTPLKKGTGHSGTWHQHRRLLGLVYDEVYIVGGVMQGFCLVFWKFVVSGWGSGG